MQKEGIFEKKVEEKEVEMLKKEVGEKGGEKVLEGKEYACGELIKHFLSTLPFPILTHQLFPSFSACFG